MTRNSPPTKNATLIRLKGTPFKSASELKNQEMIILKEEWAIVERARVRRELLLKQPNRPILGPLIKGIKAKYVGSDAAEKADHLVKVYLGNENEIYVEIDSELRSKDVLQSVDALVKPLVDGLLGGYLAALGLKGGPPLLSKSNLLKKRHKS